MRFIAVYLPWVRIELARSRMAREEVGAPLAIVIARPDGAVKDERSLLGNTRLDEVSIEAHRHGVRAGQTIAAARAKTADLRVRVVAMDAVKEVLARVAEAGLAFGATTSFDMASDTVCIDVTGCAHLHEAHLGDESDYANSGDTHDVLANRDHEIGERILATKLEDQVRAMGHACRVAVADGPRVASAVARYFPRRKTAPNARLNTRVMPNETFPEYPPVIVPVGANARAMRVMPLTALPLDAESRGWLSKLGVKRIGDLQSLPPASLGTRLGAQASAVMALLRGEDTAPLVPYVPPEVPEERAELEYGIGATEQLLFVAKMLCDRLGARLKGRAMAATRIELEMKLDRAIARESNLPASASLEMLLPLPLSEAAELLGVVRARAESFVIPAPILAVTLRATELARRDARALDLFVAEAKADRALPRLAAELAADLGADRIGTLSIANSWVTCERTRLVPFGTPASRLPHVSPHVSFLSRENEPSRLLAIPLTFPSSRGPISRGPLSRGSLRAVKLLARIEAAEWWRRGLESRDFLSAWSDTERAVGYIELNRATGESTLRGWMD